VAAGALTLVLAMGVFGGASPADVLAMGVSGAASPAGVQATGEVVTEIRVHGNVATSDDEVKRLAAIEIGAAVTPATVTDATERLRSTKRFRHVDVLKRFASISDPTQIVLVIVVDEGPVKIEMTGDPDNPTRVVKSRGPNLLFFPILDSEDGYGISYGVRFAYADPVGKRSRVSFPVTWGGDKKAAVELDKELARGPLSRVVTGAAVSRRTNPFFGQDDDRRRVSIRGERQIARGLRVGTTAGWQHVSFGGGAGGPSSDDRFVHAGADVIVDTRLDPVLPRNAIYARAGWEHLGFASAGSIRHTQLEGRAYLGVFGQTVLAVRAMRDAAGAPLPLYAKPLLGGMANVRGFRAGTAAGDTLVAGSAELLVPITSPLNVGRIGVSAFVDAGTTYDHGARFADQTLKRGVGGSVWFSATLLRLSVAVAHGIGATTRVHVGGTVTF
jgi:outer membrane protein assembly factor BamA